MKKLTAQLEAQDDRPDITSLIDVIFMLLLFFIITTTFAEETFFPIELPMAKQAVLRTPEQAAVLEISRTGEYALNLRPMPSRNRLYETLAALKRQGAIKTVVIKADEQAPTKHLVWVLDALHALNIHEFAVTAKPEN